MLEINEKNKRKLSLSFLLLILVASNTSYSSFEMVKGDYNINIGQSFKLVVKSLHTESGAKIVYILSDVYIQEGCTLTITFTYIDPPFIKYKLSSTLSDGSYETALFADMLVVNRDWTSLRTQYESYNYTVFETNTLWGVRNTTGGYLEVSYRKKDGVLNQFYAKNDSLIMKELNLFEVDIVNLGKELQKLWFLTLLIIPIGGITAFIVIRHKKKKASKQKARDYLKK